MEMATFVMNGPALQWIAASAIAKGKFRKNPLTNGPLNNINRSKRMKIEKNIPIPPSYYRSKNVSVIVNMNPGDSIAFPNKSKALTFYGSLRRYLGRRELVRGKATMRRLTNGTYRVWWEDISPVRAVRASIAKIEQLEKHRYDQKNLEGSPQPQTLGE